VIDHWSRGDPPPTVTDAILVELAEEVRRHPWWQARAVLTAQLLAQLGVTPPARVVDAGCGWGVTLEHLEQRGYQVVGIDLSLRGLQRLDQPGRTLVLADLNHPFPPEATLSDAVLALDVIEHLDDDRGALRRLGSLLKPGGWLVVSVPAIPELYGEFDEIQGHRRRYLPETLATAFDGSGLTLQRLFWWGRWLVPALRRQRARIRSRPGESATATYRRYLQLPPWPTPWIARLAFALEQSAALQGRLRTGTSLFAVARRPCSPKSPCPFLSYGLDDCPGS
jgi:SAM-dependent methyltransferase